MSADEGDIVGDDACNPYLRTWRAERADRVGPTTAGALTGSLGGAAALAVAHYLIRWRAPMRDWIGELASPFSRYFDFDEGWEARALTVVLAMVLGAVLGSIVASLTHHLRRFVPLVFWATVFLLSLWTLLYAFALPHLSPAVVTMAPYGIVAASLAVFALVFSLEVPLRVRHRSSS